MLEVALPGMHLAAMGKAVVTRETSETLTTEEVDLPSRPEQAIPRRLWLVPLVLITQSPMLERVLPMFLLEMTIRLNGKRKRKRSHAIAVAAMAIFSLNAPQSYVSIVSRLGIIQMTATFSQPPNLN
jgi:hypothetical protein